VIGMTNLPEARLAREAEICYGTLALATDYDCWHQDHDDVSVEAVIAIIGQNVAMARSIIRAAARPAALRRSCRCDEALRHALMTDPGHIPVETRRKLDLLLKKYL
jgi:5'-methylthioadenosine phosphorylase